MIQTLKKKEEEEEQKRKRKRKRKRKKEEEEEEEEQKEDPAACVSSTRFPFPPLPKAPRPQHSTSHPPRRSQGRWPTPQCAQRSVCPEKVCTCTGLRVSSQSGQQTTVQGCTGQQTHLKVARQTVLVEGKPRERERRT